MKRQISTTGAKPSTIAEEAVDQLQENEKLVAGKKNNLMSNLVNIHKRFYD